MFECQSEIKRTRTNEIIQGTFIVAYYSWHTEITKTQLKKLKSN